VPVSEGVAAELRSLLARVPARHLASEMGVSDRVLERAGSGAYITRGSLSLIEAGIARLRSGDDGGGRAA
jgi:hypothetical protein